MKLRPQIYLAFDGRCEAAFRFYERCLGATIAGLFTWDQQDGRDAQPGSAGAIMHATLQVGDTTIAGADVPAERYQKPQGFSVLLNVENVEDAERVFHALAEDGTIEMPIQQTFWATRFGAVTDRFGIPWSINC